MAKNKEYKAENELEDEVAEIQEEQPTEEVDAETEAQPLDEKDALIAQLTAQASEYKDKWYRTAAEFENYKKRNADARRIAYDDGRTETIKKILFIGDNLERALTYSIDDGTKEGITMLLRQYSEILSGLGLEEINPVGEVFDPNIAEAVFSKDAEEDQESGTVDSVFLKGYKMGGKIIRYAQVVVLK